MKTFILDTDFELYRYDLENTPKEWSHIYKNIEYIYEDCVKNTIGAFFFFDSLRMASMTGEKAFFNQGENKSLGFWLTRCTVLQKYKLLDLRIYPSISALFFDFYGNNMDIFSGSFTITGKCESPKMSLFLEGVKICYEIIRTEDWYKHKEQSQKVDVLIEEIEKYYLNNYYLGLLGQRLTDFSNGWYFKAILQEKGYDGYIFNESNGEKGSDTICLFSAEGLSQPIKTLKKMH